VIWDLKYKNEIMKKLLIKFKNGDTFEVPASIIAEMRTEYFSQVDGFTRDSKEWKAEYDLSMGEEELNDWVQNNVDWEDIADDAKLLAHQSFFSYENEFGNAEISFTN